VVSFVLGLVVIPLQAVRLDKAWVLDQVTGRVTRKPPNRDSNRNPPSRILAFRFATKAGWTMSDAIAFKCPACGTVLRISRHLSGKKGRCPNCANISIIPAQPPDIVSALNIQVDDDLGVSTDAKPSTNYGQRSRQRQPNVGFRCPFCQSNDPPEINSRISTAGWVIFVILLIACFPLCVIGLFIKEDYRVCSSCGIKLG